VRQNVFKGTKTNIAWEAKLSKVTIVFLGRIPSDPQNQFRPKTEKLQKGCRTTGCKRKKR